MIGYIHDIYISNATHSLSTLTLEKINNLNFHPVEVVSRYRDPNFNWVKITHICLI